MMPVLSERPLWCKPKNSSVCIRKKAKSNSTYTVYAFALLFALFFAYETIFAAWGVIKKAAGANLQV